MDTRESRCLLCSLGCDIAFRVKGEAVVGPEFLSTDGPSGTRVCARGLYGSELLSHPQRVATPLIRRDGVLRESSWDAAIDTVGAAIRNVVEEYGPGAVAIVTEATRSSEELEAVALLARSIGTGAVSCVFEPQDWPLVARESSAGVASIQEANCVIVLVTCSSLIRSSPKRLSTRNTPREATASSSLIRGRATPRGTRANMSGIDREPRRSYLPAF
ncbi:MAG: hypothetical protein E4G93_02300 [Dehalococcoidia bacterium]|nr:MAG: hypothetical protein E4G93_02300 [Dehalococcoidia bacterium]